MPRRATTRSLSRGGSESTMPTLWARPPGWLRPCPAAGISCLGTSSQRAARGSLAGLANQPDRAEPCHPAGHPAADAGHCAHGLPDEIAGRGTLGPAQRHARSGGVTPEGRAIQQSLGAGLPAKRSAIQSTATLAASWAIIRCTTPGNSTSSARSPAAQSRFQ